MADKLSKRMDVYEKRTRCYQDGWLALQQLEALGKLLIEKGILTRLEVVEALEQTLDKLERERDD